MTLLQQDHDGRGHASAIPGLVAGFAGAAGSGLALVVALNALVLGATPAAWVASLTVAALGILAVGLLVERRYPHDTFGWCNAVTLWRGAIAAALVTPLVSGGSGWPVAGLAAIALALDGMDGWLARRQRLASAFGARFDMEVDSVLAAILALAALTSGAAGPAILVLGFARYAFAGATLLLPWLARPLPQRLGRKAVCVLQLATLIAVHVPILPHIATQALTLAAAGALAWSFGRDILWLRWARG